LHINTHEFDEDYIYQGSQFVKSMLFK